MPEEHESLWDWIKPLLAAFIAVGLILGGMVLYTGNWPPMAVVSSDSMQHSSTVADFGVLNIGDVVLVKKVTSASQITTYVVGQESGFSSYGEFGNVIIYNSHDINQRPNPGPPVIHRAILYLQYNASGGGYDIPSLLHLPFSQWYVVGPAAQSHDIYNVKGSIVIKDVGYPGTPVYIPISNFVGKANYSGFVTMGDYNHAFRGENATDQSPSVGICPLPVKLQWIVGIAEGYLPYVGLIKLELTPGSIPPNQAPAANSVYALVLILTAIVTVPIASELVLYIRRERRDREQGKKKSD